MHIASPKDFQKESLYKRIRVFAECIYRNSEAAVALDRYISSIPGVHQGKSNPLTGRILILFDEDKIHESELHRLVCKFNVKQSLSRSENVISINPSVKVCKPRLTIGKSKQSEKGIKGVKAPYHALSGKYLEKALDTSIKKGLSTSIIKERLKKYGYNVLEDKGKTTFWQSLLEAMSDTTVKVLLGASVVSLLLGQLPEALALGGIILLQTVLGAFEQFKSEKSLAALGNILVQKAKVMRSGKLQVIDSNLLVPGDIILCEAGDKVPADGRILECQDFKTSEATLTGESAAVLKSPDLCPMDAPLGGKSNMLFMGTMVLSGKCKALVVSTGMHTEIGKIAELLNSIQSDTAPIQRKAEVFINKLIKIYVGLFSVVGTVALAMGASITQVLLMGVTFFLGSIPEGLPVTLTTCMALSVHRMSKKNAIVRKLTAVESLGSANVICCDKTGTLTMNEMTVREVFAGGYSYYATGIGYNPQGAILPYEDALQDSVALNMLLKAGTVCNTSSISQKNGSWIVNGDPTEGALLTMAYKNQINVDEIREQNPCIMEIPFDSRKRYMTAVTKDQGVHITAYTKGAYSVILEKCSTIYEKGCIRPIVLEDAVRIAAVSEAMADKALRVLAFAYKAVPDEASDTEEGFTFLGLVGMEDPPREGVKESIKKCIHSNIRVVMITGDHERTARAIGSQLGLLTDGLVVSGSDLEKLSDKELDAIIGKIQVFARATPEQKYRIVKAMKRCGYIVAMTGDGVNDAPAIKEAHIGIAMGRNGSDVTREAACITLVDDNFSTIVSAIEEGRCVKRNIRNTVKYLFAGAIGEMLSILLAFLTASPAPLLAMQMIWINLISETLLGSSFAAEHPDSGSLEKLPQEESFIDKKLGISILKRGLGIGLGTFLLYKGALLMGVGIAKARTLTFCNFIGSQIVNMLRSRSDKFKKPNPYMGSAFALTTSLLIGIVYLPFGNSIFSTVPLNLLDWGMVMTASILGCV